MCCVMGAKGNGVLVAPVTAGMTKETPYLGKSLPQDTLDVTLRPEFIAALSVKLLSGFCRQHRYVIWS